MSEGAEGSARVVRVGGPASPYDPSYHLLTGFREVRAIVAREKPDVLEIHSPYLAAIGALAARPTDFGVRTFQWHSDFIDTYAGVLEARVRERTTEARARLGAGAIAAGTRPLWALVRSIARRCDATLVAAAWQQEKLSARGVPRVVRVPFGVERSVFRPEARSAEGRRRLLALVGRDHRDEVPVLVGVGRFAIEKRWDVVIDAFLRLRRERDAVLVLFGDGPERARMTARARGSPDLALPGFTKDRDELARALASADALVHGCPFETFGLSIAEAMSAGLPAVVPDEGGAAEMHRDGAGERYRALDVEACARAIARLLDRLASSERDVREATVGAVARLPDVREQFAGQVAMYADLLRRGGRSARR